MKKISGQIIYTLTYPLILLLVRNTERSYVAVIYQDKILLTRNWLSNRPIWRLPGGGHQSSERAIDAAVRELKEETGVAIEPENFEILVESRPHRKKFTYNIFYVVIDTQPEITANTLEIIDAKFIDFELIGSKFKTDEQVETAIDQLKRLNII